MRTPSFLCLGALGLCMLAGTAAAQGLYRHADANGRVTYSDRPPAVGSAAPARSAATPPANSGGPALPYALRQTQQRYPVTLYTRDGCEPCATGRTLLQTRGIPFQELTVNTPQDAGALQRLSGENSLPLLTVGSQQLKGFSDSEWSRYLDAAGYAGSVQLPAGYQNPPAQPMVAANAAPTAAPAPTDTPARRELEASTPPAGPTADNPAGIRF